MWTYFMSRFYYFNSRDLFFYKQVWVNYKFKKNSWYFYKILVSKISKFGDSKSRVVTADPWTRNFLSPCHCHPESCSKALTPSSHHRRCRPLNQKLIKPLPLPPQIFFESSNAFFSSSSLPPPSFFDLLSSRWTSSSWLAWSP